MAESQRRSDVLVGYGVMLTELQPIGQIKGAAADKHQLSSLLNNAFSQREALEERIAQNKKSSRTARTKYGF